jgi:carboxypeptidase T
MPRLVLFLTLGLAAAGVAQDFSATLMEAKLYVNDTRDLDRLGDLAGDLYICSRGVDEQGAYLVLVTDAEQVALVRQAGLDVDVTWTDLDDKFRLLTGADPDYPPTLQDFGYYFTYWEMRDSVQALAGAHPSVCSLFTVGVTSQGRDILCVKLSDNVAVEEDEPACYFSGACHGDEPMGTSIVMAFLEEILSGYGTDPVSTWLIDNREIYTVPILNPDCSSYCSDSGGPGVYWRKNRRVVVPPNIGVDPSRNHGYKWGCDDVGSSPNPSAHAYRGPYAWSDAEASAARDLAAAHRFRTEQDFHCYGRFNSYPWSCGYAAPPEPALMQEVVDTFQMYNHYLDSTTGQISQVLYLANGTQPDWALSDTAGKFSTYSFVIEADTWFYACWNDSALMQQEIDGNVPGLFYLARIAGVWFDPVTVAVDDTVLGNSTGRLDPGETADLWFTIRNRAIHPLDSAYAVSARLVSLDTLVTVLDSVRPFPVFRRRSSGNNRADPFVVSAAPGAPAGDTVRLRLETSFTDAGGAITMPVEFELVLGGDPVAVAERPATVSRITAPAPTIVGGVLSLPRLTPREASGHDPNCPGAIGSCPTVLLDAAGRKVLDLRPGPNDLSRLAPGVYFVTQHGTLLRRVVVAGKE